MVHRQIVDNQLKHIGADFRFLCRSEAKELPKLLFEDETIVHAVVGIYENGFALLCATDKRLLLVDKKPLFLKFEDIRYEMISEVDFIQRFLNADLHMRSSGKVIKFRSYRATPLRNMTNFVQEQVMYLRQQQNGGQQITFQPQPVRRTIEAELVFGAALQNLHQRRMDNPYRLRTPIIRHRIPKYYNLS